MPLPALLTLSFRCAPRVILLGLLVFVLCLGRPTVSGASPEPKKQEKPYALIFGTVWGPEDHPLYGVRIKIRRLDQKKAQWELYSDHHGEFAQRLPSGAADYLVWADVKGYKLPNGNKLQASQEVKVHIENDERADIGLHLK
jgi:hypothetical protein